MSAKCAELRLLFSFVSSSRSAVSAENGSGRDRPKRSFPATFFSPAAKLSKEVLLLLLLLLIEMLLESKYSGPSTATVSEDSLTEGGTLKCDVGRMIQQQPQCVRVLKKEKRRVV